MGRRRFRRGRVALIACLTIVSGAASPAPSQAPRAPSVAVAGEGDKAAVADTRTYLKRLEKLGFAGVVLVAKGGAPLLAEGFGLADREHGLRWTPATVSYIGSITKQFTGAAILKLEEDKRLNVTDPITLYFKDVPADKAQITLHQLLTHSSGLGDPEGIGDYDPVPLAEYVRRVSGPAAPLRSRGRIHVLQRQLQPPRGHHREALGPELRGLPPGAPVPAERDVRDGLHPAAMGRRSHGPGLRRRREALGHGPGHPMAADGPHWALRANGGIHSTVYDMLRWARALLDGRVLSPESMKKLWAPHVSEGGDTFYGYGWSIAKAPDGTKIVTHNGGNGIFFADLAIVPDAGLVVFLMTNVIAENRVANSLLEQIGLRFLAGQPYPSIPEIVDLDEAALAALAGTYRLPGDGGGLPPDDRWGSPLHRGRGPARRSPLLNSVREAEPGRLDKLNPGLWVRSSPAT